jgi:hypothetical protein
MSFPEGESPEPHSVNGPINRLSVHKKDWSVSLTRPARINQD